MTDTTGPGESAEPTDTESLHPDIAEILQHFAYAHLPAYLQAVSRRFSELAWWMASYTPYNQEVLQGLRNLLTAKDCAVRARRVTYLKEKGLNG